MKEEIVSISIGINTTGSAGSATGSAETKRLHGFLLDVYLDYHASAPATTDLAITLPEGDALLAVSDNNTDGRYAPLQSTVDNSGEAISGAYVAYALNGKLGFSVTGCDALTTALTVTLRYLRLPG